MLRTPFMVSLCVFTLALLPACEPGGGGSSGGDTVADAAGEVVADSVTDAASDALSDVTGDTAGDATAPYCPGSSPPPLADSCRSDADCDGQTFCRYPGQEVCGICRRPDNTCDIAAPSTSCGDGLVCISRLPACPCSSEAGTYCVPSCAANPSSCGAAACLPSGLCAPESCLDQGVECRTNFDCHPQQTGADAKGCVRRGCAADTDCECGACVFGRCYEVPGVCSLPVP